jgi:hypothetical protein
VLHLQRRGGRARGRRGLGEVENVVVVVEVRQGLRTRDGAGAGAGSGLAPSWSSAMIRRIDARISSIDGSCVFGLAELIALHNRS